MIAWTRACTAAGAVLDFDIDLGVLLVASRKELPYSGPLFENADAETQTLWVRKKTAEHTYCTVRFPPPISPRTMSPAFNSS